jgi:ABC-type multidrug transport system fused ATPase/permease subunit
MLKKFSEKLIFFKKIDKFLNIKIFLIIILSILTSLSEVFGISLIIPIIDILLTNEIGNSYKKYLDLFLNEDNPNKILSKILIIFILVNLVRLILIFLNSFVFEKYILTLKVLLLKKIMNCVLSVNFYSRKEKSTYETIRNIYGDIIHAVNNLIYNIKFISEFIYFSLLALLFSFFNLKFFFVLIIILIIMFLIHKYSLKEKILNTGNLKIKFEKNLLTKITETMLSFREIILSKKEKLILNKISKDYEAVNNQLFKINLLNFSVRPIFEFLFVILISLFFVFINLSKDLNLNFSYFAAVVVIIIRLIPSLYKMINLRQSKYFTEASLNSIKRLTSYNFDQKNIKNKSIIKIKKLEFKNIFFSYDNDEYIFKNFNQIIKTNKIIGIEGISGSGKSTFIDLLLGFKKPNQGSIIINDQLKIDNSNLDTYQNNFSFVSQDFYLFNDDLKNNITLYENTKEFDQDLFDLSLKISNLKDQFKENDKINLDNKNISGGQAQRIAIARAIYQNKNFLIMDEPTSMLDIDNSIEIINNLKTFLKEKTILVVSHNKEIMNLCDEIIYIKKI